jgi:hypothetical protein
LVLCNRLLSVLFICIVGVVVVTASEYTSKLGPSGRAGASFRVLTLSCGQFIGLNNFTVLIFDNNL